MKTSGVLHVNKGQIVPRHERSLSAKPLSRFQHSHTPSFYN